MRSCSESLLDSAHLPLAVIALFMIESEEALEIEYNRVS